MNVKTQSTIVGSLLMCCALGLFACSDNNTGQTPNDDASPDVDMTSEDMPTEDMSGDMPIETEVTLENTSVVGSAVKGPFAKDSIIRVFKLDEKGQPTTTRQFGRTNKDGRFLVPPLLFDGWAVVEVEGKYFDELTGEVSEESRTLKMLGFVEDGKIIGNINLFSDFTFKRVQKILSTGLSSSMEEARERARAEFSRIFYIGHHPEKLSILNVDSEGFARDNAVLLSFSAGVLEAKISDAQFAALSDDFAEDGDIDGEGVETFNNIKTAATENNYDTARDNLLKRFGSAPPELATVSSGRYWVYHNCFVPINVSKEKLCLGQNNNLQTAILGKEWTEFSFVPPVTGTYTFSLNYGTFNNFHRWNLTSLDKEAILSTSDSRSNFRAVSLTLEGGKEYILNIYNSDDNQGNVEVDIQPSSEGSASEPIPLMLDVSREGWVGFHGNMANSSWTSFYEFHVDQVFNRQSLDIVVNDANDEIEVLAYWGSAGESANQAIFVEDHLLDSALGKNSVKLEDVVTMDKRLYIVVRNRSNTTDPQSYVPGRMPFRIKVR